MALVRGAAALSLVLCLAFVLETGVAMAEGPPVAGDVVAGLVLPAPLSEADAAYLGASPGAPFALKDAGAPYLLIEIIGVYCPICFKQAPLMDRLFKKIKVDPALSSKLRFLGVACGATPQELAALSKQKLYAFPVVSDPDFSLHALLGQPKTPFTMLVDRDGKVLSAHLGVIDDMNAYYKELTKLTQ